MNNTLLGKKLKEARLAKKMTQSDVVGGYITRNMLSQIESGCACPSIRTLEYLSGVLEIPMSELVSESESELSDFKLQAILKKIRNVAALTNDTEKVIKELDKYITD